MQAGFALAENAAGRLRVWDEPRPTAKYVIGIDVAEHRVKDRLMTRGRPALGIDRPDFSCGIVLEMETGQHVATWHGPIEVSEFSVVCAALGLYYNCALLVPEVNGPGIAIVDNLVKRFQYPQLYRSQIVNIIEGDPFGYEWGWRTTASSRPLLVSRIQETINYGRLFTRDFELVKELRQFQYDEQGTPRARGRDKDDRVMALGMALIGRAAMMYGTLDFGRQPDKMSRLSHDDQNVWRRVKAFQKRIRDARRNPPGGVDARFRPLPRSGW